MSSLPKAASQTTKATKAAPKAKPQPQHAAASANELKALALNAHSAQVLRKFRQVFNAVKTHFREVERQAGVGGAQLWALSVISASPGIGVGGLAAAMDIHQSTASNLLRSLAELEFVETRKHDGDRRAVQLHILPKGQRILNRAPGPMTGVLPQALAALDQATLLRLSADLDQVIAAINADEHDAGIPLGES